MEFKIIEPSGKIATMISTDALASLPIDDSGSNLGQTLTLGNNTVSGTYTFDFTTAHPDAKFITQNNLISFKDKYSKDRLYTITRVEDTGTGTATAYCYDYLLVLINSIADSWDYTGDPHPIAFYVDKLIANTGMQIGINEISNLSRALKFEGESDTYLTRLGDVANQFGGAEVDCSVETDGIRVTGVYINIYKHIGKTTLTQDFISDINLDHTERTIDIDRLRTALKAKGGTPEGENQKPITFADIAYDDGQYYTPKGDPVLYDRINGELWSQTRITNSDKIGWIFDNYSYDTLDPQLLLTHTLTKLKSVNIPEATYTVNSVNFEGDIGDSVRVTDLNYEPELYLKARVSQVNNHYTAQGLDTGVLANYELLRSEIDPNVKSELDKISKLPGKPGKDGVGIKSTLIQYASNTSGTVAPTTGWSANPPALPAGQYMWTKNVWTYTDGSTETGYSVGKAGGNGQPSYTHWAWADSSDGKTGFSLTASTGKKYIGVYSDTSSTASSDPAKYHWTELIGNYVDELNATIKDIQASIKAIPAFTSGTVLPSSGKNGDQFYLTNSAGVVTDYYVYASGWVKHKLDAATLNVGTLSALSANLGTINAGTLNAVKLIGAEFNTSSTFTDPNNAAKKVTSTQLINKDGYKMVVQRNWFGDIVLETSINAMGIISTGLYEKADFDAGKAALSKIVIDPLNSNISISNTDNSVLLNGTGLYLYDATNSKGVQLKRISDGFQVLASPKTGGGLEDAVLDLKGNKSGINFHVGDRDDIDYDSQIVVEGRYGKDPKTNRAKMHLIGNSVVLNCFDAVEVRGANKLNDAYHAIRASAFNVSSNPEFKTNIKGYDGGLALINGTDVYRYALKDELKNGKYSDHIGMMLDSVPNEIVGDSEGIDLYSAISVAWSAIKELSAKVEEQDKEIEEMKGKMRKGE